MLERIVLIVDDNARIESVYIPLYMAQINELKNKSDKWRHYNFNLIHKSSMYEALDYLKGGNLVDVLVVDYDFSGEQTFTSGAAFIKDIREHYNRYCQVIFYTMQGRDSIDKDELIDLINSDVFKMVDKSNDVNEMGEVIFEAATLRNPVVESLEQFFTKYQELLKTYNYTLCGEKMDFDEVINHIRMDDVQGRVLIEKIMQKAILLDTNIEA
jgi:CheY-like chemotaxis protein